MISLLNQIEIKHKTKYRDNRQTKRKLVSWMSPAHSLQRDLVRQQQRRWCRPHKSPTPRRDTQARIEAPANDLPASLLLPTIDKREARNRDTRTRKPRAFTRSFTTTTHISFERRSPLVQPRPSIPVPSLEPINARIGLRTPRREDPACRPSLV